MSYHYVFFVDAPSVLGRNALVRHLKDGIRSAARDQRAGKSLFFSCGSTTKYSEISFPSNGEEIDTNVDENSVSKAICEKLEEALNKYQFSFSVTHIPYAEAFEIYINVGEYLAQALNHSRGKSIFPCFVFPTWPSYTDATKGYIASYVNKKKIEGKKGVELKLLADWTQYHVAASKIFNALKLADRDFRGYYHNDPFEMALNKKGINADRIRTMIIFCKLDMSGKLKFFTQGSFGANKIPWLNVLEAEGALLNIAL